MGQLFLTLSIYVSILKTHISNLDVWKSTLSFLEVSTSSSISYKNLINTKITYCLHGVSFFSYLIPLSGVYCYTVMVYMCNLIKIAIMVEKFTSISYSWILLKGIPRSFAKFTGKHLCRSLFFKQLQPGGLLKKTLTQMLSCEFSEIFKNTFLQKISCSWFWIKWIKCSICYW